MSDPAPPPATEPELPEEIVRAIEAFRCATREETKYPDGVNMRATAAARSTLTTAILARLTAAEAERDEAQRERRRVQAELADIEAGNCCDGYEGQIAVLQQVLKDRTAERDEARSELHEALHGEEAEGVLQGLKVMADARDAAEAQLSAALARAERLEKALVPFSEAADNLEALAAQEGFKAGEYKVVVALAALLEARAALSHPAPAEETKP